MTIFGWSAYRYILKKVGPFCQHGKEEIAGVELKKKHKRIRELADPSTLIDPPVILLSPLSSCLSL